MSLTVAVEGVGLWSPLLPGWQSSTPILRGESEPAAAAATRPAPDLLAPNERRRAPDSVLLALEVAQQACAMAGRDPRDLPAIFASAWGDLTISDYLCATLARTPQDLSPTKFHNSVHNAPAGYWAIATGCMASTTALSAGEHTFGAGLLEAALLAHSESTPVVFACYDVAASGPLADVVPTRTGFGAAFVLAPAGGRLGARLTLDLRQAADSPALAPARGLLQSAHSDNPASHGLPVLVALAQDEPHECIVSAGPRAQLHLEISTWQK